MSNLVEKTEELGPAKEKMQVDVRHMTSSVSRTVVVENVPGFYVEHGETSVEDFLLNQEAIYQSLQTNSRNDLGNTTGAVSSINDSPAQIVSEGREAENTIDVESQLLADEALARALQEEEDKVENTSLTLPENSSNTEVGGSSSSAAADTETPVSTETSDEVREQDEVDPDDMNYEQLRSLEERMGDESKGLSKKLISYLHHYKYKKGDSSRQDENEECVICRSEYKKKEDMISLPCNHEYHKKCITKWLMQNRACPICKVEVFG